MSLDTQGRGGARPGAGRPKKRRNELQNRHSIRATDSDWELIQRAARIIKARKFDCKDPSILILSKEEHEEVSKYLLGELIEKHHIEKWGEPALPAAPPPPPKPEPEKAQTLDEEEAVSVFLQYYRLNPTEACSVVQARLDKENRIKARREARTRQTEAMNRFEEDVQDKFDKVDDLNRKIAEMLKF